MPSSDYTSIVKVLHVVNNIKPLSILDVGCGNGRYGFLFRECLDLNYGRLSPLDWITIIDAVEIDPDYIQSYHNRIYDRVTVGDFRTMEIDRRYNLVFMGDVLEHWKNVDWQRALHKAKTNSDVTLVVCPNHNGSLVQGAWHGHESERHQVVLSPAVVGGRCLFANSKIFMVGFDNAGLGLLDGQDVCP